MCVFPSVEAGTRFVCVGDSKTAFSTPSLAYPARFAALPVSAGLGTVFNLGVSGYKLSDLVSSYDEKVKPYATGNALNPSGTSTILCVWIGANDVFQLSALGYANATAYYSALCAYIAQAIADGFRVLLFTIDARTDHLDPLTEFNRTVINNAIRHNTQAEWFVDTEAVFWDYTDLSWWDADGIHYNSTGYERLAKLVAQTLLSYGTPIVNSVLPNKTNTFPKPQAFTGRAIYVSSAPSQAPGIYFMENLVARFFLYLNSSGDLAIDRHDNSGAVLEQEVIKITRGTGELVLKRASRIA